VSVPYSDRTGGGSGCRSGRYSRRFAKTRLSYPSSVILGLRMNKPLPVQNRAVHRDGRSVPCLRDGGGHASFKLPTTLFSSLVTSHYVQQDYTGGGACGMEALPARERPHTI